MRVKLPVGESITAVMSGAQATTLPKALVEWLGRDGFHNDVVALNGVTAVTLLSAAAGNEYTFEGLSIYNVDTAAVTITISRVISGTSYTITKQTLQVGDTLVIDADGLTVTDTNGQVKTSSVAGELDIADDGNAVFGTDDDVYFRFSTADASNPTFVMALDNTSQQLHITDKGAVATDWNLAAGTDPTIYVHSNTTPATDYLEIGGHDGTTAHVNVAGGTTLALQIAGTTQVNLTAAGIDFIDDNGIVLGTGLDAKLIWSTADASDHSTVLALGDTSQMLHVTDLAAAATDWNVASPTHPTIFVHSNTTPATDYLRIGNHDGTTAEIDVVGGTTISLQVAGTTAVSVVAAGLSLPLASSKITAPGSTFAPFMPMGAHAASVAPAGAIPITNFYSTLDSTAGATTATLADGAVIGQVKKVQMIVDGGDVVVTPANLAGGTTITFADAGDFVLLIWDGTDWVMIEAGNDADGVTAPVLA